MTELETLRTEHQEQARLLGISGERECALLAEIERKDAALRVAATALIDAGMYARKYGDELLNVREALATIKEAL